MCRNRMARVLIAGWICSAGLATVSRAQPPAADASKTQTTAKQIEIWLSELNADKFVLRESATQNLMKAGRPAVEPIVNALPGSSLEVVSRGIHVLRELALSSDDETEATAVAALKTLALRPKSQLSRRASAAIANLDDMREARASQELQRLGANFNMNSIQAGIAVFTGVPSIWIGDNWKGEAKDLDRLKWLRDITHIELKGEKVTDEYLRHVGQMKNLEYLVVKRAKITDQGIKDVAALASLRQISIMYCPISNASIEHLQVHKRAALVKLYGTNITQEGADRLQVALAESKIDYRAGAFLGVGCDTHPEGCEITIVHSTSSASRAGLRVGDVIVKYDGKLAKDFDSLTTLIAVNRPGDTVSLEILRGGETFTKKVTLGEWE